MDEVVSEAVDRYIRDKQWEAVKRYGVAKSRSECRSGGVLRKEFSQRADRS